jgi:hypothetical protein
VLVVAGVLMFVACRPAQTPIKPPAPPNATPFERALFDHANAARVANGARVTSWSNSLGTPQDQWLGHLAATDCNPNVENCHSPAGEILVWEWGCDLSDAQAADTIAVWLNSPAHRDYLLDQGPWPDRSRAAASTVCDASSWAGGTLQISSWAAE